jgi:hypothetical protein
MTVSLTVYSQTRFSSRLLDHITAAVAAAVARTTNPNIFSTTTLSKYKYTSLSRNKGIKNSIN